MALEIKLGEVYLIKLGQSEIIKAIYLGKGKSKYTNKVYRFLTTGKKGHPLVYSTDYFNISNEIDSESRNYLHLECIIKNKLKNYEYEYAKNLLKKKGFYEQKDSHKRYSLNYKGNRLEGVILEKRIKENDYLILLNIAPESQRTPLYFPLIIVKDLAIKKNEIIYESSSGKFLKIKLSELEQESLNEYGRKIWKKDFR